MPCYLPLTAYHATGGTISFDRSKSFGIEINLPCGRCLGCRLEKAKEWALRCSHEASLNNNGLDNSFITCTYAPEYLPENGNLKKADFQKFIKRLRTNSGQKIRYYMCGEYGDKTNRPHYHAILFNYTFADKTLCAIRDGLRYYKSKELDRNWKLGSCEISAVTFKSAGYVARYILKKQTGEPNEVFNRYVIIDPDTGEMTSRHNEYTAMSLKPGIGKKWYEQNRSDCFPHDYCVLPDGRQTAVPGYYRNLLRKDDPSLFEQLQKIRVEKARTNPDNTPERLLARQHCKALLIQDRFQRDKI